MKTISLELSLLIRVLSSSDFFDVLCCCVLVVCCGVARRRVAGERKDNELSPAESNSDDIDYRWARAGILTKVCDVSVVNC